MNLFHLFFKYKTYRSCTKPYQYVPNSYLGGVFSTNRLQKLIFSVSCILPEQMSSFSDLQAIFSQHGLKLQEGTTRELKFQRQVNTLMPIIPPVPEPEAAYYSLVDNGTEGSSKCVYLNYLIEELKSGKAVGPLFFASTVLEYMTHQRWSEDKTKVGDYYASDLVSALRVSLLVNSRNVSMNARLQNEHRGNIEFFQNQFQKLYSEVSH